MKTCIKGYVGKGNKTITITRDFLRCQYRAPVYRNLLNQTTKLVNTDLPN